MCGFTGKNKIIDELVNARICGNNLLRNNTYVKMLKRVTKEDINNYAFTLDISSKELYGNKCQIIDQLVDRITAR
jgi:hypothetical protein